jgi:hypothetical protein
MYIVRAMPDGTRGEAVTRGEPEFIRLAEEGELDKIRRILRARRDQVPPDVVNEVVQEACLEVIDRQQAGGRITNVAGLIMTIAGRHLEKTWQRMLEGLEVDAAFARRQLEGGDCRHDDEWQAQIERATEYIFKVVAGWPADNVRRTLLTLIEAAAEGMQLEPRDSAPSCCRPASSERHRSCSRSPWLLPACVRRM